MVHKLDSVDRRILFELEKNARITNIKLSKLTKKSKDTVKYRIKKLQDEQFILGTKTWIDYTKLGYQTNGIFLTLLNVPSRRNKLINEIKNDPRTYWIGVSEGVWNLGISYFIKSNDEFYDIKNNLLSKYHDIIVDIQTTNLIGVTTREKNFLQEGEATKHLTFTSNDNFQNAKILDNLSKNILKDLFNNSNENIANIAFNNKTSVDKIRSRMKTLENEGIIIRYTTLINYQKIGYEFYKSFLYLKRFSEENLDLLYKYCEKSKSIINIIKQVAPWDLELVIFAQSYNEYIDTINKITQEFQFLIKKIETVTLSEDIIYPSTKVLLRNN